MIDHISDYHAALIILAVLGICLLIWLVNNDDAERELSPHKAARDHLRLIRTTDERTDR